MKKQVRHFTLIEFFVVVFVGAVVVLGLMFLPTIITLKERGRAAHCTRNLSQIGKAFFQYAMSYDDWYPTVRSYRTETVLRRGYTDPAGVEARMHERPIDGGKWLGADSYKAFFKGQHVVDFLPSFLGVGGRHFNINRAAVDVPAKGVQGVSFFALHGVLSPFVSVG